MTETVALIQAGKRDQAVGLLRWIVRDRPDYVPEPLRLGGLMPDHDEARRALAVEVCSTRVPGTPVVGLV